MSEIQAFKSKLDQISTAPQQSEIGNPDLLKAFTHQKIKPEKEKLNYSTIQKDKL